MPSSADPLLGLELQAAGENLSTWGDPKLNQVISGTATAIAGMVSFPLSGTKVLTSTNYVQNEARQMILNVTGGTGGTITIPSRTKMYLVNNGASGDVSVSAGGVVAVIKPATSAIVWCDGADCRAVRNNDFAGVRLTNVGTPIAATDAATKGYADGLAFSPALPGQAGNAGKFVTTDGTTASWAAIDSAYIATALGYTPADASDIPLVASGADLKALTSNDLFVSPQAVKDAVALVTLTLATPDLSNPVQTFVMAANSTLGAPVNVTPGTTGAIFIKQPASGGPYTLAYNAAWYPFGTAPVLSTAANAADLLTWIAETAGKVRFTLTKGGAA